ncbi:hypothetical protein T440DRAFT_494398 [Plenodomus tracheiphilus IPT5]|uniref:SET domain-containing protein n=1 Tax=Plenodomus tracheiphilus IPT5 TaxID=1408161 RepID=A0A6A7BMB0_9PLEO|nr:hypothetical protein T440DRAFT_494398 [Plenodomus tracheiphilus IPT5]
MAERGHSPTSTSSTLSNITVQTDKQADVCAMSSASPSSSTPPTSLDDRASVLSEITKVEQTVEVHDEPSLPAASDGTPGPAHATPVAPTSESRRPARSSRKSVTTYNVQILAGTAIHTPTKYLEKHHKNVVHGSLEALALKAKAASAKKKGPRQLKTEQADVSDPVEEQLATEAAQAARRRTSSRVTDLRRDVLRNQSNALDGSPSIASNRNAPLHNSLRRSASDSRLKSSQISASALSLKRQREDADTQPNAQSIQPTEEKAFLKPKSKVWLKQGLYVGQHRDFDPRLSESQNRAKKRAKKAKDNRSLPLPIFACDRLLNEDPRHVFRDFKLPFDVYSPLPRKVKVDGWVKLNKNRFIGDARDFWKPDKQDSSQCYCGPEDGCGEACHNRIMAYECDSTNCRLSPVQCGNRPFAELRRRAKGNRYDYGVEVVDTQDRGFGVRAMRTFEPHQIIVEYAGEIITQWECERRMKQVYKKDKCYYLMSFDNKMIIDATRGTIARFVNHSCEPNCEMIKWTVGGEPRMALFAGSRGVMTGDELTYDYNFDPFSQKNIQICRCGTESCRGVLGPKPKKPIEEKSMVSVSLAGSKRKFSELTRVGKTGSRSSQSSPKKRKLDTTNSVTMKAQNAVIRSEVARERAERYASEHSRQIASRESRALLRSASETAAHRVRSANLPKIKTSTVRSKVSLIRRVPKAGGLKFGKKTSSHQSSSVITTASLNLRKGRSGALRPSTPTRATVAESSNSSEEASPNITPASLRSASKKSARHNSISMSRSREQGQGACPKEDASWSVLAKSGTRAEKADATVGIPRFAASIGSTKPSAISRTRGARGR